MQQREMLLVASKHTRMTARILDTRALMRLKIMILSTRIQSPELT
jgi:hypothetical protein